MTMAADRPARKVLSRLDAAALIREARTGSGLTQAELAERCGTKQSVVSRWERGLDVRVVRIANEGVDAVEGGHDEPAAPERVDSPPAVS